MDTAFDALLLPDWYDLTAAPSSSSEGGGSRIAGQDSWRLWLGSRVVVADAAATNTPGNRSEHQGDVWLRDAWGAVRRAALTALSGNEDESFRIEQQAGEKRNPKEIDVKPLRRGREEPELARSNGKEGHEEIHEEWDRGWNEVDFSDVTTCSSLGGGISRGQSMISSIPDESLNPSFPDTDECFIKSAKGSAAVGLVKSGRPAEQDAARMALLCHQFRGNFERNGGTQCLTQLKRLADNLLVGMRDASSQAAARLEEFGAKKSVLDNALHLLDYSRRKELEVSSTDFTEATKMAEMLVGEEAEEDACRLLAVLAANSCAAIVDEVQGEENWEERVSRSVNVATKGVEHIRVVSERLTVESVGKEAVGVVLAGGALGIAVLQVEAVGKTLGENC